MSHTTHVVGQTQIPFHPGRMTFLDLLSIVFNPFRAEAVRVQLPGFFRCLPQCQYDSQASTMLFEISELKKAMLPPSLVSRQREVARGGPGATVSERPV